MLCRSFKNWFALYVLVLFVTFSMITVDNTDLYFCINGRNSHTGIVKEVYFKEIMVLCLYFIDVEQLFNKGYYITNVSPVKAAGTCRYSEMKLVSKDTA